MFDLRYHVASLAAVFIALAVGIVIGVAIAGGGNLEETTQDLREADLADLEQQLDDAQARVDSAEEEQAALEAVVSQVYPELMEGRLSGQSIALVFLGPVDGAVRSAVERTLSDAGAETGNPSRVTVLRFPIDVDGMNGLLDDNHALADYVGDAELGDLGAALGVELARGGSTPLLDLLDTELVEQRTGTLDQPADSVVVVRTWTPEPSSDPAEEGRRSQSEALLTGLLTGLGETGVPIVGVEASSSDPSTIEDYRRIGGISSVDDVDFLPGQLALALLLATGQSGHYGTKDTADAVVPTIDPLIVIPLVGG
jgi:hypothetical protein